MASYRENTKAMSDIFPSDILDQFIDFDWITENMPVDDVYDESVLGEWALSNGYKKEEED